MKFESFLKPKSKEELEKQAQKAEEILGARMYPPDTSKKEILDISNVKDKYKTRYEAYVTALRAMRRGDLNTEEIKNAKEWITALNNLDDYIKDHESKDDPLLREKQFVVFKDIREFLEQGKKRGYVKLPARVGKTILYNEVVEALGLKTLIAQPSKLGISQIGEKMEKFTDLEYGTYFSENKDLSKNVTITTYSSLVKGVKENKIKPEDYPVLILDEGHRALGNETNGIINQFEGIELGFTATPEFSEEKNLEKMLGEKIHEMSLREAIEGGLLCSTRTILAKTSIDLSNVSISNGEYNKDELEKYINIQSRNFAALELYKNAFKGEKCIIYCVGVKHSRDVAELFNNYGIKSESITGDTPTEKRNEFFKKFKNGEIEVLTNAEVLIESYDEPKASVVFNLKPTLSFVDAEQRGSRPLTIDPENPEKWGIIVDFLDTNNKKPQILFSEIINGDIIVPLTSSNWGGQSVKKEPIDFSNISIDGLKVIVDTETIMEITNKNLDSREKWTYETLKEDVLLKGVRSSKDYRNKQKENNWTDIDALTKNPSFPKNPDGSNDWDKFLGREKKKEWTYESLRNDIISKGIKSSYDYMDKKKENNWIDLETLTNNSNFPKNPDGSNDWDKFLGREKKKEWTYETLKEDVLLKGIISSKDYQNKQKENKWPIGKKITSMPEFPQNPDGSKDWDTFLGREKFDFEKFRQDVIKKKVKSSKDYVEKQKENKWPTFSTLISYPSFPKNTDGSNDWDKFLGREKFDFEKFRQDVIKKGVKSSFDYNKIAPQNKWPTARTLYRNNNFPKNPDGSYDWDKFLGREN